MTRGTRHCTPAPVAARWVAATRSRSDSGRFELAASGVIPLTGSRDACSCSAARSQAPSCNSRCNTSCRRAPCSDSCRGRTCGWCSARPSVPPARIMRPCRKVSKLSRDARAIRESRTTAGRRDRNPTHAAVRAPYFNSMSSIASLLGPAIMKARVPPMRYGASRTVTCSPVSFASHASRSPTLIAK
jgi:hypothetical protein